VGVCFIQAPDSTFGTAKCHCIDSVTSRIHQTDASRCAWQGWSIWSKRTSRWTLSFWRGPHTAVSTALKHKIPRILCKETFHVKILVFTDNLCSVKRPQYTRTGCHAGLRANYKPNQNFTERKLDLTWHQKQPQFCLVTCQIVRQLWLET